MTAGMHLLHLTPHLGGGVGRALVSLARGDQGLGRGAPRRTVLCLEAPERQGAARALQALGVPVQTLTDASELASIVARQDLVQLEAWNHPRMFDALARLHRTPARVVPWCHVSGLHFPRLPQAFWQQPMPVALTAPCSLQAPDPGLQAARARGQVRVISSAAGFEHWPAVQRVADDRAWRLGYLGTLNAAKMHPDYVDWLAATGLPDLCVQALGDEPEPGTLARRCAALGQPGLVRLAGFCDDVPAALAGWDVLVYLLNPHHYGTAEIALLEAMASGVVPIVGDHACERDLVQQGRTGWVVRDPGDLRAALLRSRDDPDERRCMGRQASAWVRDSFTTDKMAQAFHSLYEQALAQPKAVVDWPALMGRKPWQWFVSTLDDPDAYPRGAAPVLPNGLARWAHFERSKGSVHHFARCFPADAQLAAWSAALSRPARVPQAVAA